MEKESMNFFEKVYHVCKQIPKGKVSTYGQIATMIGSPKAARQVGWAMNKCSDNTVPCYKVLNRFGELCKKDIFMHPDVQKQLLEEDGIVVSSDYKVDLKKYLW